MSRREINTADPARRICIIRPSALGDVCRSVPVLASLKRSFPGAEIDWVVQDAFVPAIAAHPDLHEAIPFPRGRFSGWWRSLSIAREMRNWFRSLARREYDLVYDCQGLARSGFLTWSTRAPKRVGFRHAREGGSLGYTHRLNVDPAQHVVDLMLSLLEADGIEPVRDMRLYTPPDAAAWWNQTQAQFGITNFEHYVVLAPTSRWESKQWPDARFAELINPLIERGFNRVVLVGAQSEREQCPTLIRRADGDGQVIDLIGPSTISGLMAIIEHASLVIANDSAPLHMAVGYDRRYVGLYGPTDVTRDGPYHGARWVVQKTETGETFNRKNPRLGSTVMERISVSDVVGKVDELLSEKPLSCPDSATTGQPEAHPERGPV